MKGHYRVVGKSGFEGGWFYLRQDKSLYTVRKDGKTRLHTTGTIEEEVVSFPERREEC